MVDRGDTGIGVANSARGRIRATWAIGAAGVALCLLFMAVPVARFVGLSAGWISYPYPRPGSEGLILYESLLLKHGGDIYAPITPERFISGPYPPVYYWLASATLPDRLPDFSGPEPPASEFQSGRTISLVSALIAAALIPFIVAFEAGYNRHKRVKGVKGVKGAMLAGGVGGAVFLALPQTIVWATRFRGDMLMVALTAAGLLCVAAGFPPDQDRQAGVDKQGESSTPPHLPRWTFLVAGALFFALAFFTKQTALAGPAASAAYLLLRERRTGLRWCLLMAACVGLPFLLLDVATGHWFFLKMVTYHSLPLRGVTLTRLLQFAFLEDEWPIILLGASYAVYRLFTAMRSATPGRERQGPSLVALFTLAALAFLPTGAVVGADHNHLLVPGLAISLAAGAALSWAATTLAGGGTLPALGALIAAVLLTAVFALVTSAPSTWYDPDLTVPTPAVQEQYRKIVENVRRNPGTQFFSDDPGIVALAGKETPFDDPFTMKALAQGGRWDESAYRASLREGKFGLLLLSCDVGTPQLCRADTFTPGVLDAIGAGYKVLFRDIMYTYAPK